MGQRIWLAGIKDALEDKPDLDATLPAGLSEHEPVILLAHEPDFRGITPSAGRLTLVLSGHTHGGADSSPLVAAIAATGYGDQVRARACFAWRDGMQLYVNRGIGAVTPGRFGFGASRKSRSSR